MAQSTNDSHTVGLRERLKGFGAPVRQAAPFAAGVLAGLLAVLLYTTLRPPPPPLTAGDVSATVAEALAAATPAPATSTLVYQAIQPSIVYISTQSAATGGSLSSGIGTGVIINDRGDILTSLHVVADAVEIQLFFADGSQSLADIAVAQPENDIAVLAARQLPAQFLPATLGNPNALQIGDEAFVVGHPLGLYGSMSVGVISGLDRSFRPPNSEQTIDGLIQIDAAVNPGSSGGPLLNRAGQVVGIVAGLVNPTQQEVFIGLGFAVPINVAASGAGLPPY
jgi:S1-C subfamily serine protease